MLKCVYSESVFNALYFEISDKINGTKMPSFFFRELQLITVLLLICDSYMIWSTKFASLKLCVGFSIFDFPVYIFAQQNAWTHTQSHTHSFATRPLIFKLQIEVLKFNDICMSWGSPKTDLMTSFLNPENRSFENVSIVTFQ